MHMHIPVRHYKNGKLYYSIRHYERVQKQQRKSNNNIIINSLKSLYRPIWSDSDLTGWQAVIAVIAILILFMIAGTLDYQTGI